jgi:ankyrin repeat protein
VQTKFEAHFSTFFFLIFKKKTMAAKVKGNELLWAASDGKTDEILRLWKENGETLDVEFQFSGGWTPLLCAATNGYVEACRALISTCHANVDCRNDFGYTPLMLAARYGYPQCVEVLLELGADITLRDNVDVTALEYARDDSEVAALLESASITMVKSALKV